MKIYCIYYFIKKEHAYNFTYANWLQNLFAKHNQNANRVISAMRLQAFFSFFFILFLNF